MKQVCAILTGLMTCMALAAPLPAIAQASSGSDAERDALIESCLRWRSSTDADTYCPMYADTMLKMTPMQTQAYLVAKEDCLRRYAEGTSKYICEEEAIEVARNTYPNPQVDIARSPLSGIGKPIVMPDLSGKLPSGPLVIDKTVLENAKADQEAGLTLRVPVTFSGLPTIGEMEKYYGKPAGVNGGEPYFIIMCEIATNVAADGTLRAAAGVPWVVNGGEKTETVSLRFSDRFNNGALASTARTLTCSPWFGLKLKTGEYYLRGAETFVGPGYDVASEFCKSPPNFEVGHDDTCSWLQGKIENGQITSVDRHYGGKLPDGVTPAAPFKKANLGN
ncbi:hypothetical protein [Henriciella litoralis]|uniref:hypothetical protein n=1 Tax=Henriciella litoralis TaxID=568102 RepID=UPI00111C2FAC|nr:hypothetical protein [Henriciella litoralis]